jgi:long-chain acyl-CoA synthetase
MLPTWLASVGRSSMSVHEAAADEAIRAEVQKAVDEANRAVSRAESVRRFRILPVDFTEESGYLTPSLKVKRSVVLKDFAEDVESLYR